MANILNSAASFSSQRKEGNDQVPTHLKMATCFIECGFGQLIFFSTLYFSNQRLDGGTPIHLACRLGTPEILQCLYEHDPAAFQHALVDKEVMTPLHRFVTIRKAACFLICLRPIAKSMLGGEDVLRKKANLCCSKEVGERENPAFIAFCPVTDKICILVAHVSLRSWNPVNFFFNYTLACFMNAINLFCFVLRILLFMSSQSERLRWLTDNLHLQSFDVTLKSQAKRSFQLRVESRKLFL